MTESNLYPIVSHPHINIFIPKTSHFSIGTSPYYAHQKAVAIDIYDQISIDNYNVISPISGKVLQIKQMQAPKPKFKDGLDKEYLTLIKNPDDNNTVFKILHIKPELDIGQHIEPGDPLGKTIRNGYFAPWSSPHIHLELKKPKDALRAKEGLPFNLNIKEDYSNCSKKNLTYFEEIPVKIKSIFNEFFLCRFPNELYLFLEPFYGVKGIAKNIEFIIDGGIPQYKHGVIHFLNEDDSKKVNEIYLNKLKIGILTGFHERYGYINFDNIKFLLNNKSIRGISLFLAKFRPLIKLIPFHHEDFKIKINSIQYLKLVSNKI